MKRKLLYLPGVLTLVVFVSVASLTAPSGDQPEFISSVKPILEMSKQHTLEVLEAMPAGNFNYRPTEVSKTFAEQMVHIGYTLYYFNENLLRGNKIKYEEPDAASLTKADIRALIEKHYDDFFATLNTMTEEDLATEFPFYGDTKMSRSQAILFALDHTTNHRAKANLYLRENDIEPPSYKFM